MARYFYPGSEKKFVKEVGGDMFGGMEKGNDPDRHAIVVTPALYGRGEQPLKSNGIAFGFVGHGFWHIAPGDYVDLPDSIPRGTVKNMAPQLLDKDEALAAGICHEDGTLVKKEAAPEKQRARAAAKPEA